MFFLELLIRYLTKSFNCNWSLKTLLGDNAYRLLSCVGLGFVWNCTRNSYIMRKPVWCSGQNFRWGSERPQVQSPLCKGSSLEDFELVTLSQSSLQACEINKPMRTMKATEFPLERKMEYKLIVYIHTNPYMGRERERSKCINCSVWTFNNWWAFGFLTATPCYIGTCIDI